jgi:hypothetical protein
MLRRFLPAKWMTDRAGGVTADAVPISTEATDQDNAAPQISAVALPTGGKCRCPRRIRMSTAGSGN